MLQTSEVLSGLAECIGSLRRQDRAIAGPIAAVPTGWHAIVVPPRFHQPGIAAGTRGEHSELPSPVWASDAADFWLATASSTPWYFRTTPTTASCSRSHRAAIAHDLLHSRAVSFVDLLKKLGHRPFDWVIIALCRWPQTSEPW